MKLPADIVAPQVFINKLSGHMLVLTKEDDMFFAQVFKGKFRCDILGVILLLQEWEPLGEL